MNKKQNIEQESGLENYKPGQLMISQIKANKYNDPDFQQLLNWCQQSVRSKSKKFHASVAKQKKQTIFRTSRYKNQKKFVQDQMDIKLEQINNQEIFDQFSKSTLQRLQGKPNLLWIAVMNQMLWSLKSLKRSNRMDEFIERGIISQLCRTFKKKYQSLNLASQAAELLSKLIYIQPLILDEAIQYSSLRNVIFRSIDESLPYSSINNFIELMTTIIVRNQKHFMQCWGIEIAFTHSIMWLKRIINSNKFDQTHANKIYKYLQLLMKYLVNDESKIEVPIGQMKSLFEVLQQMVEFKQDIKSYSNVFEIVLILLNYNHDPINGNRPDMQICLMFVGYQNLTKKMVQVTSPVFQWLATIILELVRYQIFDDTTSLEQLKQAHQIKKMKSKKNEQKRNSYGVIEHVSLVLLKCLQSLFNFDEKNRKKISNLQKMFLAAYQKCPLRNNKNDI